MDNQVKFYPSIKGHISPSALAAWWKNRSLFIRSYFKGEKTPESSAMKFGKQVHALIEGGFIKAVNHFDFHEQEIVISLGEYTVLGKPDSFNAVAPLQFVDYKTGRENHWTIEELAQDLKMKCTAWLVWASGGKPQTGVKGFIEWIGTRWDEEKKELIPTGDTAVVEHQYSAEELVRFTDIILETIKQVNEVYPKWLEGTSDLVNEDDCRAYAELEAQIKELEAQQKEIKERIGGQLEFGGRDNHETPYGTFYITTRKTYDYPETLQALVGDKTFTLAEADKIDGAMAAVKKEWELTNDPKSISRSVAFRAKRKK